ncbi:MAG: hypothetical protein J5I52_01890 [Saprospiraceae bacterium]|nr:MAG: hypothetical protein UZ09_BCD002001295 [Bacteroidetes bacterium OLB9]MCO6462878.1 hypothetical protein [Saprospiraceae bacterium]
MDLGTLISKANKYKQILKNTELYREAWHKDIKPKLTETLGKMVEEIKFPKAEVIVRDNFENLESVTLDLGRSSSGIYENLEGTEVKRVMVKSNGSLIYQQLFNGKIMVMILSPNIEGYGQPKPPMTVEILRPDELNTSFVIRHMELFLNDITEWEDFDDDQPSKSPTIGFNPIGFHHDGQEEG